MKAKKCLCLLLAGVLALCGCSSGTAEREAEEETAAGMENRSEVPLRLSVATVGTWTNVVRGEVFQKYTEKLSEWSDGQIQMELYDGGRLGDDKDLIAGVQLGTLCIINSCPAYQIDAVPEAAMLDAPGIFTSVEQYNTMMESGYLDVMQEYYHRAGLQLLASFAYSFRQLSSNKAVYTTEDLQGLRVRTMENKYHEAYWEALGAISYPLVFSELYIALRQGNMDAQENSLYNLESSSLGEVQDYAIFTYHAPMVSSYVMNKEQYDALTEEQQELLARFMEGIQKEVVEQIPAEDKQFETELVEKYGMTMIYPDEDTLEAMRSGKEAVLALLREDLGDDVVDDFLLAVESAEKEVKR